MTWRDMGKANFIDIQDRNGRIQAYVRMNDVGEEVFKEFKTWDLGDIVEIKGFVFKTKTGEISIHAKEIRLLSKSLLPLPEKFHGLTDTDTRYRRRYLDMIMNPDVKETFIKRSKIITSIRNYLDNLGFIEVETPILNTIPGGAAARPFITHHNTLDMDMYLRIATELYLKRLIVGGMERVYEIGRNFRNEGMDVRHNPEFTCIELYQAFTDYHGMMDIAEALIRNAANEVCDSLHITFNGTEIDLETPFRRLTMIDAVKEYSGVDFASFMSDNEKAIAIAKERILKSHQVKQLGVIFSIHSLKNLLKKILPSLHLLWIIRLKSARLQRESLTALFLQSVLNSLLWAVNTVMLIQSLMTLLTKCHALKHR